MKKTQDAVKHARSLKNQAIKHFDNKAYSQSEELLEQAYEVLAQQGIRQNKMVRRAVEKVEKHLNKVRPIRQKSETTSVGGDSVACVTSNSVRF